jgi:hypothetical protein
VRMRGCSWPAGADMHFTRSGANSISKISALVDLLYTGP